MKKLIFGVLAIVCCLLPRQAASADFYFLNMPTWAWTQDCRWVRFALGAVASIATHELGHFLTIEATGTEADWGIPGQATTFWPKSDADGRIIAASGMVLQLAVNTMLTASKSRNDFAMGYTFASAISILSYPLRHPDEGDLSSFGKHGGNETLFYVTMVGIVIHNVLRMEW